MLVAGLLSLVLLSPPTALAQGVFRPKGGEEARWNVNPNHVLLWNSAPYLPFGLRISASLAEIEAAKAAGIQDVLVDCPPNPGVMKTAVEALERHGLRYILCIDALSPSAQGILIEPSGNRISGITAKKTLEFQIYGADEALLVLAVRRDGFIQKTQRIKSLNGAFSVEVAPPNDLDHVALIFPKTSSLARLGAWEGFDRHRDAVLTSLQGAGLGKGLRGILNPLGSFATQTGPRTFVPTGPLFRYEFAAYLKQRYRNPQTLMRSWEMSGTDEKTFDQLARFVPLWSGSRGVPSLWDPQTDQFYACDMKRSSIWRDLDVVLSTAEARRTDRLIKSIRRIADVPIVQEWSGWAPLYEGESRGLDGLGARAIGGSMAAVSESSARAASTLLRWPKSGWFLATHVDLPASADAANQVGPTFDDLISMGVRGGFIRSAEPTLRTAIAQVAAAKSGDTSLVQWTVRPFFFPESASNPALAMRLPGGSWWLPAPGSGGRIELGSQFNGYRLEGAGGRTYAIWARSGRARVRLDMAVPQRATFQTVDGTDPKPKIVRNGVEVDIGELPLLVFGCDEIPIPAPAYEELIARFGYLIGEADARHADTTEERFLFRDHLNGYPRNPGGAFSLLYGVFQKLSNRLARYVWIEAETTRESTFSEITAEPGVSGGNALALRTQLLSPLAEYAAEYTVQPRTDEEVECWVAARLPKTARDSLKLEIGGQKLAIEGEAVSGYGSGYAWYSLGRTRLGRTQTKVVLKVAAPEGTDLAVDAIVFFPGSFRPQGVKMPDALSYPIGKLSGS